jgi:hypothetical protein
MTPQQDHAPKQGADRATEVREALHRLLRLAAAEIVRRLAAENGSVASRDSLPSPMSRHRMTAGRGALAPRPSPIFFNHWEHHW